MSVSVSVGRDDEGPVAADALGRVTWARRRAEWAVQARRLNVTPQAVADVVRDA
ncbi:hypothetical protein ACWC5C_31570 [Streptomyces sp. NPDC001700]